MAKDRESTRPDFSDRHFSTSGIVTGNMASSYADPAKQHPVTMHPEMREHLEGSVNGKELHSNGVEREDHEDDSDCADPQDCAELLQPFSDSQVGMRKWEATMNCVDRPSKSVNASGIIEAS